ncbi:hypothetical protein F5884DRAFT_320710 [Xylogone sp. PMI_703]|nr:hypothetical protein F5884DRAFT_320710 [Xylogone sp. PMI_703]
MIKARQLAKTDKPKRRRTGCITCRARRIKCDEGKPTCERCEAANIECLGYEEKRRIDVRQPPPRRNNSNNGITTTNNHHENPSPASSTSSTNGQGVNPNLIPVPRFRPDGLPLIAYPINPHPSQVPHARSRYLLAYHQYLFRTLSVLFCPEHWHFWRERVCEQAWETESQYVFDAVMAVGGMHRAILMMSMHSDNDRNRGEDWQVIAVQSYTKALEELAEKLDEAKQSMDLLVGVLLLFAYFECFFGNIVAAIRHVHTADHYFLLMRSDMTPQGRQYMGALGSCLQDLKLICRIVLPFPKVMVSAEPLFSSFGARIDMPSLSPSSLAVESLSSSAVILQRLLKLGSLDSEIEELIWSPLKPYSQSVPANKIQAFQENLVELKNSCRDLFPSDAELDISVPDYPTGAALDQLPMPPCQPHTRVSSQMCLTLALYNFYMARTMWALAFLSEDDSEMLELSAYFYFYEQLKYASMINAHPEFFDEDPYLACEAVRIGFIPMLYVTGHCAPKSIWLEWIIERLVQIGQEGLFNAKVYAKSLEVLHTFELGRSPNGSLSNERLDRFPSTAWRIISVLVPELDGNSYITFYAGANRKSASYNGPQRKGNLLYYCQGHARWSSAARSSNHDTAAEVTVYDELRTSKELFTMNWLLNQPVISEWVEWSRHSEFDLDHTLQDHINGSCLRPVT